MIDLVSPPLPGPVATAAPAQPASTRVRNSASEQAVRDLVADVRGGVLNESEGRRRLAGWFLTCGMAHATVYHWGRGALRTQTALDMITELQQVVIDLTLDGSRPAAFRFCPGANYGGWARSVCLSGVPKIAKKVMGQANRCSTVDFQSATSPAEVELRTPRPDSQTDRSETQRAMTILDQWETESARARASARLQASARALIALAEVPALTRLGRDRRAALAATLQADPDAAYRQVRALALGECPPDRQLAVLWTRWTAEDAHRFLAIGDQRRRREASQKVALAAVSDYPRPSRQAIADLRGRLLGLDCSEQWQFVSDRLTAAFLDTECEAVSELATVEHESRRAEYTRNLAEYARIVADAACALRCSPLLVEQLVARHALEVGAVYAIPERLREH